MEFSKIHHCKPWCCFLSPIAIAKSQSWDLRSLDIQTGRSWLPIQWRIQKLFLQLQKKKIQLKKKETKVAPIEDPEVVPPAQEGDQSCSSRGSRSCSSNSRRRRPKQSCSFRGSRSCSSSSQRRAKDLILHEKSCVLKSLWTREDPLTRSKRGSRSKMKDPGQVRHKIPVQNPRRRGSTSQHIPRSQTCNQRPRRGRRSEAVYP